MNKTFIQKVIDWVAGHRLIAGAVAAGIFLAIIVAVLYLTFIVFLVNPAKAGAPTKDFTVKGGDGLRTITTNLKTDGIVPNDLYFVLYLKISGLSGTIQAGDYRLSASMSPLTIADILTKGKVASRTITIPEGWNTSQIGAYLEKQGITTKDEFTEATKKNYSYDFLKDKPADVSLEGFLFPDTYQVSVTAKADDIVKMMLSNFDKRVTSDLRSAATASGYNLYQIITLSSIVELEVSKPEDRRVVAGIFLNRLNKGMKLQSDVTLRYALGTDKKTFSDAETTYQSPYNTYYVDGLPRGPIDNPGLESINAVYIQSRLTFCTSWRQTGKPTIRRLSLSTSKKWLSISSSLEPKSLLPRVSNLVLEAFLILNT